MAAKKRVSGLTIGWRLIWRQIRANPSVAITIFGATFLAVAFLAATPRLMERISNDALRVAVTNPPVQQRSIAATSTRRIGASNPSDRFKNVRETGARFADDNFSFSIGSVVADQTYLVDSPKFGVFGLSGEDEGPFPTSVRFRYQEHIDDHAQLVAGRLPRAHDPYLMLVGSECPEEIEDPESFEESDNVDCTLEEYSVFEAAMTAETMSVLSFGLGEMVLLRPDPGDPLFRSLPLDELNHEFLLMVTGVIELSDQNLDYWYGDARLHRASITENADFRIIAATGLLAPDEYGDLLGETRPVAWQYTWRYFVDPDLIEASTVKTLEADLLKMELGLGPVFRSGSAFAMVTRLPTLIDQFLGQREVTAALMSVALAGVFAIAIALNLELAGLAVVRQRNSIVAIRNRGSSGGQLILTRIYQALLVIVPAAVLGYLHAGWLIPDTDYLLSFRLSVAFAAAASTSFVAASLPLILRRLGALQRDGSGPQRTRSRVVVELLVVAISLGAVILLRRRGQIDSRTELTFDPLLSITPALLGVAVGLVTLRVYPFLVGATAKVMSRGRSLVPFVGFRRILQQPPLARLPIVVIVLATAIAVFSVMVRASVSVAQEASAWQEVGADYTVQGSGPGRALPNSIDLSGVDSIEALAAAISFPRAGISNVQMDFVEFLAIDAAAYEAVVDGSLGDSDLLSFLFVERGPETGTAQAPLPVVVSTQGWPPGQTPTIGDEFTIDIGRLKLVVRVEAIAEKWPGLLVDRPFVVSDIGPIDALSEPAPISRTSIYLRAPSSAGEEIESTLREQTSSARFNSRYEALSDVADAPLVMAVDNGLMATLGLSVMFAAVSAVSSLALSSAVRRRDLGYLRAMGLEYHQAAALTVIEQLPLLAVAASIGGLLGAGMVIVLQPAIGLDAFTGGFVATTINYDWWMIIIASVVLTFVMALSIVIFVAINRRDDLGSLVKVGDD